MNVKRAAEHHLVMASVTHAPKTPKRPKGKRRKAVSERRQLVAKLDKICSEIVRRRDGYQCVLCGSRSQPQCGHVIVRGRMGTRFDLMNMHTLCASCNLADRYDHHKYTAWLINKFGIHAWDAICEKSEKSWEVCDLRALLEHYETLLERAKSIAIFDADLIAEMGLYG